MVTGALDLVSQPRGMADNVRKWNEGSVVAGAAAGGDVEAIAQLEDMYKQEEEPMSDRPNDVVVRMLCSGRYALCGSLVSNIVEAGKGGCRRSFLGSKTVVLDER